ncbi:MAG: VWA domain-containing protein [Acidobacteria bacterium]|nr:VWA domain-containing protein [Acidobacteriota bacterium]
MKYTAPILCLALAAVAAAPATGQALMSNALSVQAPGYNSTEPDSVITIQKRVDEVNVLFIAMDKHGKFVRDLKKDDFSILDDHKPPQTIVKFTQQTDLPLRLGLLIDTSGSVHGRFQFEQDAAIGFLQHTIQPYHDRAFVMGFNAHTQMAQDFTFDLDRLSAAIQRLQNGGGTALYDAVYTACKERLIQDDSDRPMRHALIIVSDGEDNQSEHTRAQAIEMAQRAQVIIYTISTDDSGLILRGDKILEQLANATGGRAFFPFKMKDIQSSFSAIEDELRSQYAVSYHPADFDADGRYRSIEITAVKKDLQVRARKGYFAPQK